MYSNIDSLLNKRHELAATISSEDIIFITEVIPKNYLHPVQECEIQLEDFDLHMPIQRSKDSRGVLIYTRKSLRATPSAINNIIKGDEQIWCEVPLKGGDRLLVGCVYRSPSCDAENNHKIMEDLKTICNMNEFSHILICGDFNIPGIKWDRHCECEGKMAADFLNCFRDCFLYQHVYEATHHRGTQTANILDLVFTNEEDMTDNLKLGPPIGKSHHSTISFTLKCSKPLVKPQKPRFIYEKADWEQISVELRSVDWDNHLDSLDCAGMWNIISGKIISNMDKHIPKTKSGNKPKKPAWMNEKVLAKIKQKHSAFKRYMNTREGKDYQIYAKARNQAKWECRKAVRDMERKIANESKENPKAFFRYANSKLKTKTGIADLDCEDGGTARSDQAKAEVLNNFFCSVFTKEDTSSMPSTEGMDITNNLSNFEITAEEVHKKLRKLNPNKACGPDNIPPSILKHCANELSNPLATLMNRSLQEGILPSDWKVANVTPIFKKGKKTSPGNYRPVSLTSVCCKVMESILRDHFIEHFKANKLFNDCQHGFMSGRSCSTNLLSVLNLWTMALEEEDSIDTIYLDFAKAFDTVPHKRLLRKLQIYGIDGQVHQWVENFLTGRKQKVVVNGEESAWGDVLSGIPQGSVLGPFLFVCFINDLPDAIHSTTFLFADDTKIFAKVPQFAEEIQEDLDRLQLWSDTWQLRFNAEKCKVMHIGKNEDHHDYKMTSKGKRISLESVSLEKDLGVNVDSELKFREHINIQVNKANKLLALLRRGFASLDSASLSTLYKSIIRPHLEYGNVIWHPKYKSDEDLLESVQRRMSRLIPELSKLDYAERLKKLDLPSLFYRRARGDMIECYKYLSGLSTVTQNILPRDKKAMTRGHSRKLLKPSVRTSLRANFFSVRVVNSWNALPEEVVSAPSLNAFKNRLDKFWSKYKYTLSSDWFKAPPRKLRTPQTYQTCERNEDEHNNNDSNERPIGD